MSAPTPDPTVTLRTATLADAEALAALHLETLPGDVSDFTPLGRSVVRRFYRNAIARGLATAMLAESAGDALGFVLITPDISVLFQRALLQGARDQLLFLLTANPFGLLKAVVAKLTSGTAAVAAMPELVYLGVRARARGRGCGGRLLEAAQEAFRAQGVPEYELNVHADNPSALNLYLGHGFEVVRRYHKSGHDVCAMRRRTT